MPDIIDFHVNILPPFARENVSSASIPDEVEHLRRCFDLPLTKELNERCSAESIIAEMDAAGITRSVVFSYQWKNAERCRLANKTMLAAVEKYKDRLLGLAVVQPGDEASLRDAEKLLCHPNVLGVKVKPRWGGFSLSDIRLLGPLCEMLISREKVLLTHVTQGFHSATGDQVGDLLHLLKNFPRLKVIAAHLGGFIGVYELHEPVRRHLDNLYIDISLPSSLPWLPQLMRLGNPSRYLFATDWPYSGFAEFLTALGSCGLSDDELEMVLHRNANDLLRSVGSTV